MRPPTETTPELDLTPADVREFLAELEQYRGLYHDLFYRSEQREQYDTYLQGLLSTLPNKSVETMVLHMHGDDPNAIRSTQHFISAGRWADQAIIARHWTEVARDLGDDNGVIIVDDTGFPKQGQDSVGVQWQWCGQLGKQANCQVGVFTAYASQKGYTLLDRRLYVPKKWLADDDYMGRRVKCGLPPDRTFKTKPELAVEMVADLHAANSLPFRWVVSDAFYGRHTAFLDEVSTYALYFAEVPSETRVWRTRPATAIPPWTPGRGRKSTIERLAPGESDAEELRTIPATLPPEAWSRYTIKEGRKGPMVADFAFLRVVAVRNQLPGPDVWLIVRREVTSGEYKFYLSNAPCETTSDTFVWLAGMRWPIETCFEAGKQELGLGDYQLRSWTGWHHHMTLCILAHFFLVRLQLRLKNKAPDLTLPQAMLLLKSVLPQPRLDVEQALEIVGYYQRRHHAAYLSHRKRRLKRHR